MISAKHIKDNLTMKQVLDYYNIPYHSGNQIDISCPFPDHNDIKPSFSINMDKDVFHCKGCGRGGSVIDFVSFMDSINFKRACDKIEKTFFKGGTFEKYESRKSRAKAAKVSIDYSVSDKIKEIYGYLALSCGLTETGKNYLKNARCFSKATIERFGLLSIDEPGKIYKTLKDQYCMEDLKEAGLVDDREHFLFKDSGILIPYRIDGAIEYLEYRYYKKVNERRYSCLKGRSKWYFTGNLNPDRVVYMLLKAFLTL